MYENNDIQLVLDDPTEAQEIIERIKEKLDNNPEIFGEKELFSPIKDYEKEEEMRYIVKCKSSKHHNVLRDGNERYTGKINVASLYFNDKMVSIMCFLDVDGVINKGPPASSGPLSIGTVSIPDMM